LYSCIVVDGAVIDCVVVVVVVVGVGTAMGCIVVDGIVIDSEYIEGFTDF
jgi:hypothetical protein